VSRISPPGAGWRVEVDLPGGTTVTPSVIDDNVSRNPTVNGYPSLSIPVPKQDIWESVDIETNDVAMRAWKDGQRQPVDQLERVTQGEGATHILEGRGGLELQTRVEKDVDVKEAHLVAQDIVQNNSSYAANVDTPSTTVESDVTVQSPDSESEWLDALARSVETSPIIVQSSGDIELAQTSFLTEAENAGTRDVDVLGSDPDIASNGEALGLSSKGSFIEETVTLDHRIPEEHVEVAARVRFPDDSDNDGTFESPGIEYRVDGSVVGSRSAGEATSSDTYGWAEQNDYVAGDLTTGDHDVRMEVVTEDANGATVLVDAFTLYDGRYHDPNQFDDDVTDTSNQHLESPANHPNGNGADLPARLFEDVGRPRAVTAGEITVTVDDTAGIDLLGLSNDGGQTFDDSASGTDTHSVDFAGRGASIRWRMGLSAIGSQTNAAPLNGHDTPTVDTATLTADLEDMPLVVNQTWDTDAISILQDIAANIADFLFEIRIDNTGSISVEWAEPGARSATRTGPVSDFERERIAEDIVEKVVVKGAARTVEDEPVTATHGTAVDLDHRWLNLGSEVVRDPETGISYDEGADYQLAVQAGTITTNATGAMTDGETYEVSYEYHPAGDWSVDNAPADPRTVVETLSELPTARACAQVARLVGESVDEQLIEGRIVVPSDRAGWDVISAVDYSELPFDGAIELRDVVNTPEQTALRVGSRESVSDVFERIRTRLSAVSRRA